MITKAMIFIAVIIAVIVGVQASQTSDQEARYLQSFARQVIQTAENYPEVVADVDGKAISGKALAQRELLIARLAPDRDRNAVRDEALQYLIEDEVLLEMATEKRMWVSPLEVSRQIKAILDRASLTSDLEALAVLAGTAAELGVKTEDLPSTERLVESYRRALTLSKVRDLIAHTLSPDQQQDQAALRMAIEQEVSNRDSEVRVYVK